MGEYGNEFRSRKTCVPLALFVAGMFSLLNMPACADFGSMGDIKPDNAMTSNERAKAARKVAVENAGIAFEKAKAAGAERRAPFEYYLAEEYLLLAREEYKEGDRIGVGAFAAESEKYSAMAIEKAKGGSK